MYLIILKNSFKLELIQIVYSYMKSSIPIEYEEFLISFIWSIDMTPTGTTILCWSEPGSNGNKKGALQISIIEVSP